MVGERRHHLRDWSNGCVDGVMLDAIEDETVIFENAFIAFK